MKYAIYVKVNQASKVNWICVTQYYILKRTFHKYFVLLRKKCSNYMILQCFMLIPCMPPSHEIISFDIKTKFHCTTELFNLATAQKTSANKMINDILPWCHTRCPLPHYLERMLMERRGYKKIILSVR